MSPPRLRRADGAPYLDGTTLFFPMTEGNGTIWCRVPVECWPHLERMDPISIMLRFHAYRDRIEDLAAVRFESEQRPVTFSKNDKLP